jgi:hypothetical protein
MGRKLMKSAIPLLQNVRVAAPCHVSWDYMTEVEGDRVRFCRDCQKRVYNLSALSQAEAEGLLRQHEGNLCVRYYQRKDGTILTTDCPVGLKAMRALAFKRAQVSLAGCVLFCLALWVQWPDIFSEPRITMGLRARPENVQKLEGAEEKAAQEEIAKILFPEHSQKSKSGKAKSKPSQKAEKQK